MTAISRARDTDGDREPRTEYQRGYVAGWTQSRIEAEAALLARPVEPVDVDYAELERLARAATPGPWRGTTIGNYDQRHAAAAAFEAVMARRLPDSPDVEFSDLSWVLTADESLNVALVGNGANGPENAAYIAAANPATVLRLLARRAPGDRRWPSAEDEAAVRLLAETLHRVQVAPARTGGYPLEPCAGGCFLDAREVLRALAADSRPEQPRPLEDVLRQAMRGIHARDRHPGFWEECPADYCDVEGLDRGPLPAGPVRPEEPPRP